MADNTAKRLVAKRARALALIQITRREDLLVQEIDGDPSVDFVVRIANDQMTGVRHFGVKLHGAWPALDQAQANRALRRLVRQTAARGPFPMPVVLFYFTMQVTAGWCAWVAEPVMTRDRRARLRYHTAADASALDDHALDALVDCVNHWYEALSSELVSAEVAR